MGHRTKPALSETSATMISTAGLVGITDYDPSEYTFTALAGTPLTEINAALSKKGQYLPCAPLLCQAGATLGGAIASGLSGPERFRYGGLRDFLLGIQFISGDGSLHRSGGKVVKNSAGFDLPKFFVGSLGRFGILTEVTFKVFPAPPHILTLKVPCPTPEEAVRIIVTASSSRWELNAIDYHPSHSALYLQLGGPRTAIETIAKEIQAKFSGTQIHNLDIWSMVRKLTIFPSDLALVKIPLTPKSIPPLEAALSKTPDTISHYSVGGNVALIATPDFPSLSSSLENLNLRGMTIRGPRNTPLWTGKSTPAAIHTALKSHLDPLSRFPTLS